MKKILIFTILVSLIVLTLSSCSLFEKHVRINDYLDSTEDIMLFGKDITISYDEDFKNKVYKIENNIDLFLKDEVATNTEMVYEYNRFYEYLVLCNLNYKYLTIYSDMYVTEYYSNLLNDCYSFYEQMSSYNVTVFVRAASTKYKEVFFKDYSDEDIQNFIDNNDISKTSESATIRSEMNEIQNQYSLEGISKASEYLYKYKTKANELAKLNGYENYIEYSNENVYYRDYTTLEVLSLKEQLKQTIIPLYNKYSVELNNISLTDSQKDVIKPYLYNFMGPCKNVVDSYAKFMGGSYLSNYKKLWTSGNYFYGNNSECDKTAYQWQFTSAPYLFFNKGYQHARGFIHEFGHYNASYTSTTSSYDLLETQSQGNEMLFLAYLEQNNILEENVMNYYKLECLCQLFKSIIFSFLNFEFEYEVYSNDDLVSEDYDSLYNSLCNEIGFIKTDYWKYTLINSPCYYISYATSAISALSIYTKASLEGLESAKESYFKIIKHDGLSGYKEVILNASLDNPFEATTYDNLKLAFN